MKLSVYEKICNFLIRCFYVFCGLFPFLMAFCFSLVCFFEVLWRKTSIYNLPSPEIMKSVRLQNQFVAVAVICLMIAVFAFLYKALTNLQENLTYKKLSLIILSVFFITFIISSFYIFVFGNTAVPFSEYGYSWLAAHGDEYHLQRYSNFFSWSVFVSYIKFIVTFISDKYIVLLILNAVYRAIVSVLIVLIVNKIFKRLNISVIAAMVYALMPSSAMHAFTGGPEILSTVFAVASVLLFLLLADTKSRKLIVVFSLLIGATITLAYCFKVIHLAIAAASMLITYVLFCFVKLTKEQLWFNLKKILASTAIIALTVFLSLQLVTVQTQSFLKIKHTGLPDTPNILSGLDLNGQGQIIISKYQNKFTELLNEGKTHEQASNILSAQLKEEWSNASLGQIFYWQITKNIWAWQDDLRPYYYFNTALNDTDAMQSNPILYKAATNYLPSISQIYYAGLLLLCFSFCILFKDKKDNYGVFCISLYIFGCAFCLALLQSQSHYKSIIIPFLCIISALGAEQVCVYIKQISETCKAKRRKVL